MIILRKFTQGCVVLASKCLPDSFVLVILLSFIVFLLGIFATGQSPLRMINHWGSGTWNLLGFSMQMALVLVLGQALASASIIKNMLTKISQIPQSKVTSIMLVCFLSLIANWINWGFGLVISAIFAKEIAKNVKGIDYRLLIASAYSGFVIWHGGLSGSIPLTLASGGDSLSKTTQGLLTEAIPTSLTIFSSYNLIITAVIIIFLPLLLSLIHPDEKNTIAIDKKLLEEDKEKEIISHKGEHTIASSLEQSFIITALIACFGFTYIIMYFYNGGNLNLNIINLIFLFLGILLHKTPISYIKAINKAARSAAGIILQFPFYAGIMGMMNGSLNGGESLVTLLSVSFTNIANADNFAFLSFLSAGIVNIFVPSGGGQWAVQAPIMLSAGATLGVKPEVVAMAIAWGDAWTNMIQPFWALPALAIAGLGAKDIMGYCVITLLFTGVVISCGFFFLT
ncbi:TIGR00366 family protein [Helicobacter bilis]|uniref:TIGR00366 family protein n=2 Tax=Helicobacter bilis TaxID=37372 RepID=A0A6D2CCC9_9HELI|nr:TIGR00366 family protein [Helicobacter bilis]EMZ41388.1 TIGR00366 family protein [Helicobacter bilis WiWa]TLE04957.1 TIGR00366 family protein [Helicobacter bilis]TLE06195.1 TIGR00366 family protein [Helicobacter bilis]